MKLLDTSRLARLLLWCAGDRSYSLDHHQWLRRLALTCALCNLPIVVLNLIVQRAELLEQFTQ